MRVLPLLLAMVWGALLWVALWRTLWWIVR